MPETGWVCVCGTDRVMLLRVWTAAAGCWCSSGTFAVAVKGVQTGAFLGGALGMVEVEKRHLDANHNSYAGDLWGWMVKRSQEVDAGLSEI